MTSHPHHAVAAEILAAVAAKQHRGSVSAHGLAEVYPVLTKLPLVKRIAPSEARAFIDAFTGFVAVVDGDHEAYRVAIGRCQSRGLMSGVVYDALHLAIAERAHADLFVTFNPRDFERLVSGASPRICRLAVN